MDRTRVEMKHAVPEDVAVQLLAWGRTFLPQDRRGPGVQRVTSLYLDSPELTFYHWHREGRRPRLKLRVRAYGDTPGEQVFAEVKYKNGWIGRKTRAAWPAASLSALLTCADASRLRRNASPALTEFVALRRACAARPTLVVSFVRQALRSDRGEGETAVTVDRHIAYRVGSGCSLWTPESSRRIVLPPRPRASAIVELKFSGPAPPAWMATLLRQIAPYRVSFSKYVAAARQHHQRGLGWN